MTPIYHITHVNNLQSIMAQGGLWADSQRIERQIGNVNIGHSHIKERRLKRPVSVSARGFLGDYVPFNFCNRSVMLYAIFRKNILGYVEGQEPIVHLVSSIENAIGTGRPWAFTDRHADVAYARYFDDISFLAEVNWSVMALTYWFEVKEQRQAEFLVHNSFPWTCVEKIAVYNNATADRARNSISNASHQPPVVVEPAWYY